MKKTTYKKCWFWFILSLCGVFYMQITVHARELGADPLDGFLFLISMLFWLIVFFHIPIGIIHFTQILIRKILKSSS